MVPHIPILKPLILLSGPDGSGKTTLATALKKELEKKGYKVKIVRIRGTHTLAYLLLLVFKKVLKLHGKQLHYYQVYIPSKITKLWLMIEFISIVPPIIIYYYFYRIRNVVISERSLLDFVIWVLKGLINERDIIRTYTFRVMLVFTTKYKPIYITASIDELIRRKPLEKSLILKFLPYYTVLSRYLQLKVVDTSRCTVVECVNHLKKIINVNL